MILALIDWEVWLGGIGISPAHRGENSAVAQLNHTWVRCFAAGWRSEDRAIAELLLAALSLGLHNGATCHQCDRKPIEELHVGGNCRHDLDAESQMWSRKSERCAYLYSVSHGQSHVEDMIGKHPARLISRGDIGYLDVELYLHSRQLLLTMQQKSQWTLEELYLLQYMPSSDSR